MRIVNINKFRKYISLLLVVLLVFLSACGETSVQDDTEAEGDNDGILVGMSFDSFLIERWQRDCDIFVSRIKELDNEAEVNIQNANGDIDTQRQQIKYLIEKNVDVLVIVAIDSNDLSDLVAEARDKGIPVIAYDRLIKNANVDLYISFDNTMVGKLMGEALVDAELPNKKVLMLSGPNEDSNVSMVEEGFRSVMEANDVEIVDCYHAAGWKAEESASYVSDHISTLNEVDGIMCGNDNIATTIIRTLSEARLAGKIKIVGQDADLEACQRIVEGTQVMTVYKPVERLARAAAEFALQLAKNKEVTGVKETINDGKNDVPYYYIEPIAVNKDNMDSMVIDSGFHLRDEVYMNVPDEE